jgi:uncharacterized protein
MFKAILTSALLGLAITSQTHAAQPLPPVPQYYLLDEASLLTTQQQKAIATILIEHDHATGQQLVVAIFKSVPNQEDANRHTRRVFEEWQIGKRGTDNGALLTLYAKEQKARLEAGYGLPALNETRASAVLGDFMAPELKAGHPYRAIALSVLEILRTIESPLIESGRAEQLLEQGGLDGNLRPVTHGFGTGPLGWFGFLALGILLSLFVLNNILAAEAHFTGEGWYRPNPWKLLTPRALLDRRKTPRLAAGGTHGEW